MKKKLFIPVLCAVVTLFASCYATAGNSGKVPPGQVKKATGSKSAKPYAPGQNKN
ncbi:quinol oxidase subunit 4 [Pedobacter sp.]|uniref:quinol oxidase subunit 4 n=1 Tax=Pedobacter sp. TaxID=1411316 RepID=UPI0031E13FF0